MVGGGYSTPVVLVMASMLCGCAAFKPGLRSKDLIEVRQPTTRDMQNGLEVSVEEFVSANKSQQAFDSDIAPYGVLALLLRVENKSEVTYQVRQREARAFLGDQLLHPLRGKDAAIQAATRDSVGKALAWTAATGPFAIVLWPVTIAGSGSHTQEVNRRIEHHFENFEFGNAFVRPNQIAGGFLYFRLPDGIKRLDKLAIEVVASDENNKKGLNFKLALPTLELSAPAMLPSARRDDRENN